ncbi:MAG: xylulokinase [Actinomycetota bacterium]|nr:xylulokinase [Actinomycetota bacterium]MDP9488419.1 xylulokinase [Actinomycetota bacterium]
MLLGLDLGTGSAKAVLVDEHGALLGEGAASYRVRSPQPGWAESDPEDWWRACTAAVRAAVGERGPEVRGLGLSGQMHGVVLSDAGGQPLRPAVLWADARSVAELAAYRALASGLLSALANPPAVGMAGPSLLWLRENEGASYRAARWALQPKDWLRLRLTEEAAAEPSDASATLLYDLDADGWAWPVIEALGLRAGLLAPLVPSAAEAGTLGEGVARELGLPAAIPVAAGAGDTAAAALGMGLLEEGVVQLTVGTGGQILAPRRLPSPDPARRTHLFRAAHEDPSGRFYALAAVQNAGLALEWVLGVLEVSWEEAYREAFDVPPGAGGAVFLPYLSGERTPHFDPGARGAWVGLRLGHGRGHLLRAAFEGVAFALREGLDALEAAGIRAPELRLAGGGTAEEPWRRLLADILGRPLLTLPTSAASVASARGAALLAGIAAGIYETAAETLPLAPEPTDVVTPKEPEAYERVYAGYRETSAAARTAPRNVSGAAPPTDPS